MYDHRVEYIAQFPKTEIERRCNEIRKAWNYEKLDHIPLMLSLDYNPWGYTMHDELYDHDKQFTMRMHACEQSLKYLPDDYIPSAFINVGCVGISSAFGCEIYKGENPWQTPGIAKPILSDIEQVSDLAVPDVRTQGFAAYYLERLKYFWDRTQGSVFLSGLDSNGPVSVAMDLLGSDNLFISMYDEPELLLELLQKINKAIVDVIEAGIEITGSIDAFTSTDFFFAWCPEGKKGHYSADLCASYSPQFYRQFDVPASAPVLERYGGGLLHNCGPNPCLFEYANQIPRFSGVNLAYNYSHQDIPRIKQAMRDRIVYFIYEEEPWSALEHYKYTMEQLAPDVIAIPVLSVTDETIDPSELYGKFREVSEEYARRVFG